MAADSASHTLIRRTRLLVLATSYPRFDTDPSGAFVAELNEQLFGHGFEPVVVALNGPPGGALASWEAGRRRQLIGPLADMVRRSLRHRAEMVLSHWLLPSALLGGLLAALPGRLRGVPQVGIAHGGDLRMLARLPGLAGTVRRVLDGAICVSQAAATQLAHPRTLVTPMGVNPAAVGPAGPAPGGPLRLLFVGRLVPIKGLETLLAAAGDMPLSVAGDGPERSRLEALAGPNTRFLGAVGPERRRALFREHHLVCVPSLPGEGTPRVAIEALCAGRPVLASHTGGLPQLLPPAAVLPPGDVHAWRARLATLAPATLTDLMPAACDRLHWSAVGARIAAFLRAVWATHRATRPAVSATR